MGESAAGPARGPGLAWAAAAAAFAAYAWTAGHRFAFDDEIAIVANRAVNGALPLSSAVTRDFWGYAWPAESIGSWRPVVSLLFALEWRASGGRPWLFHLDNALLHALAAWLFARHLAARIPSRLGAAGAAALFALQAIHADAVASVVGRADVVAFVGLLGCTLLRARATAGAAVGAAACFGLALGAKEISLAWVVVLLAWDLRRGALRDRRGWPAYALCLAVAAAWLVARHAVTGFWLATVSPPPQVNPLAALHGPARWLCSLRILGLGAQSMFVPTEWDSVWGAGTLSTAAAPDALALLGLASALALALVVGRAPPDAALAAAAWLVPALALAQLRGEAPVMFAERWWYTPSAGAAWLAGAGLGCLAGRVRARAAGVAAAGLCLLQVPALIERASAWRDTETVLRASLAVHPRNVTARAILGIELFEQGRRAEAARAFVEAHRLDPTWGRPMPYLARLAALRGDLEGARAWMARWQRAASPKTADEALWWVRLLARAGRPAEAMALLRWMRGQDLWSDEVPAAVAEVRAARQR